MGKNNRRKKAEAGKKANDQAAQTKPDSSFLSKMDKFSDRKLRIFFWISFFLTLLLCLLFFDPKVSTGGDDSIYINRAYDFLTKGNFPTFQGPLYPMFLSLIIAIAGFHLTLLKMTSILFMLGHLWFYYKTFKKYLTPSVLSFLLIILATNYSLIVFASTTYSEPFFFFIQSIFIYLFDRYFIDTDTKKFNLKLDWLKFVIAGFIIFLMVILRNMGSIALITALIYFSIRKQWLAVAFITVGFLIFQVPFTLVKRYGWHVTEAQMSGQSKTLFLKNPYKSSLGEEDLAGYFNRFIGNSQNYLSHHFMAILGLKNSRPITKSGTLTLMLYAVFLLGMIMAYRQNKFWFFVGLYIIVGCGITFVILQLFWNQDRLILIFTPLILTFFVYTFYNFFNIQLKKFKFFVPTFLIIILLANTGKTLAKIPETITALNHYMKGDRLYGYSTDWINYLEMVQWCAHNLPDSDYVACRKPGMAFIYSGGREFYGIYNVPSNDAADLYKRLKDAGVRYVIVANLLFNPDEPNGRIITTIHRYLSIINTAYPDKLEFVHKIGGQTPAFLYKLK